MNSIILIFKALSDQNRLRIYSALKHYDELCACQIIELLNVTGATASRHLSQLVNAGLIKSRKEGRWIYYSLKDSGFRANVTNKWLNDALLESDEIKNDLKVLESILNTDREELCRKQRGETCCPIK